MTTALTRLTSLKRHSEAGAIWQRWLGAPAQAVPELLQDHNSGQHAHLFSTVQPQQQQHFGSCMSSTTGQLSWQHSINASNLLSCISSTSTSWMGGVHRRCFSSCSSSYHNADSSSNNGGNSDETTTTTSSSSSSSSSGSSSSRGKDMAIVFTCAKCDTRSVKAFSKHSYDKGLVLVRCPGCKSLHLIADHLGWFGDTSFKIEEYMAAQGQAVKRVSLDAAQQQGQADDQAAAPKLTAEDLAGWSKVQQLLSTVAAAAGGGNVEDEEGAQHGGCSSNGSLAAGGEAAAGAAGCGGGASAETAAATAAAVVADSGVVQVAPEDVEAWTRVRQQQQG